MLEFDVADDFIRIQYTLAGERYLGAAENAHLAVWELAGDMTIRFLDKFLGTPEVVREWFRRTPDRLEEQLARARKHGFSTNISLYKAETDDTCYAENGHTLRERLDAGWEGRHVYLRKELDGSHIEWLVSVPGSAHDNLAAEDMLYLNFTERKGFHFMGYARSPYEMRDSLDGRMKSNILGRILRKPTTRKFSC